MSQIVHYCPLLMQRNLSVIICRTTKLDFVISASLYYYLCYYTDYKQSTHYCPLLVWRSSLSRRCRTFVHCLVFVCRTFLEESEEVIGVPWLTLDV